jgi:tripartite-type tricarboxylate transporter receptor subunit TctC
MSPLGRRAALALPLALAAWPAAAQRGHAVELLVGGRPGSPPDLWARAVAPFLERHWTRVSVGVRNHPGRGGLDAMALLAANPQPNRKLIGVLTAPALLARAIEAGEPSPLERVVPLAAVLEESMVLVGAPGGAADVASLKAGPAGRSLGTPAPGSAGHVAALRLDGRLELAVLAFPSGVAARQAAHSGHVAAAMLPLPDAIQALREGRLVGLGIAAGRRSPLLPDLATLREQGIDLVASAQRGFALPPGIPDSARDDLLRGLEALVRDPDFIAEAAAQGQTARFLGPAPWLRLLARVDLDLRRRWQDEPWLTRRA